MRLFVVYLVLAGILFSEANVYGWGVYGHTKINRGAVLALPKEMGMFFYNHADFLTEEAVAPDIRKYTMNDRSEFPRHYIDLEWYGYSSPDKMPRTLDEARKKFGRDSVDKYGALPWTIEEMMAKLTEAMRKRNREEILFLAANIGHYVADAHMPLHTSLNHDGQLTGQEGIHSLWESQIPEQFGKNYSLYAEPHYIENVDRETWAIIDSSFRLVDPLLYNEKKLRKDKPVEMLYKIGSNGQPATGSFGQKIFSFDYAHVYNELITGMVESRMRSSVQEVASYWYTAWVNAGKPDLSVLDPQYITDRNQKFYQEDIKYWKKGKVTGFKVIYEY